MKMKLDRRGAIAALSAVVMIPVLGFAGLAVDLGRVWLLSARLKTAVDAASLVAARTMTASSVDDASTRALFWANFNENGWSRTYLGSTNVVPTVERISDTRVRVTATASLNTTLFSIISRQTVPLRETTLAEREGTGLELAIVLDQTSSMNTTVSGVTKLAMAQSAVGTLLGILYGTSDTKRNLWASVVPFARTINIGTSNASFLNTTTPAMPTGWDLAQWSGCVEARSGGADLTDIAPTGTAGQFRPYFYASTYRRVGWASITSSPVSPPNSVLQFPAGTNATFNANAWRTAFGVEPYAGAAACTTGNAYPTATVALRATNAATTTTTYTVAFCRGDNDWSNPNGLQTSNANLARYNPEFAARVTALLTNAVSNSTVAAAGRNTLCAQSPILPLTASRATVQAAVNAITAPVKSGGTTVVTGMQGAWYTLSPNWQSQWPNIASGGALGTLPLAYNTRNMNKAVVILTDGDNNWQPPYSNGGNSTVRTSPTSTDLLYNAYGRVTGNALPPDDTTNWNSDFPGATQITTVNQTNADAALDARFSAICTAMKGTSSTNPNDHRIRIYVIGFEVATSAQRTMLQNCASGTGSPYYLEAPSASALQGAFETVANSLSSLRLVE
ncbi:TadE/TadG family type IV pilus assembly protein [Roseomonas sp. CAU 1739]|uniref:TadE/TadG family type IV pilus assembly protein n=1 Tax=Roseomonas sp. CAU 1739 TaxID=3140364 RepID=UPI00325AA76C